MIPYADAAKFLEDSLDKQLVIIVDSTQQRITNADIIGESLTITESLCSEPNLYFGAVEPSSIKFTVRNDIPKLYSKWITVQITPHGAQTAFTIGHYRVWFEKGSADRTTREVTAYDGMYKILQNTYKKWYNSLWEDRDSLTMKQFRDAYFARLIEKHPWLSVEQTTLPNDTVEIVKSERIPRISGKDILSAICEMNGVFGHLGRDNVFRFIKLSNSNTTYPIATSLTIGVDYEDYVTNTVDRIEVLSPSGDVLGDAGEDEGDAENKYVIQNNFLIKGLGDDDTAKDTAEFIAEHLLTAISGISFIPVDAEIKGNPCYEVGDRIMLISNNTELRTFILEREMTGIQSLRDTFAAEGEGSYPDASNTISSKIQDANSNTESVAKNSGKDGGYIVAAYNDTVVVEYTIDGQDY